MQHELGHVLGFRHEHIRIPQSDADCRDGGYGNFRQSTPYDSLSVMIYDFCGGIVKRPRISAYDAYGACVLYGAGARGICGLKAADIFGWDGDASWTVFHSNGNGTFTGAWSSGPGYW